MLKIALTFFLVSLISGVFGFSGVSNTSAGVARVLFFVALVVFVITIALALFAGGLDL